MYSTIFESGRRTTACARTSALRLRQLMDPPSEAARD